MLQGLQVSCFSRTARRKVRTNKVLCLYFLARFLAFGLINTTGKTNRSKIARLLAQDGTGKTQVLDWLIHQFQALDEVRLLSAMHHAMDIISDKTKF